MALPLDARLRSTPGPVVKVAGVPPQQWQGDLLAVCVTEEDVNSAPTLAELDSALDGAVADAITSGFKGKQVCCLTLCHVLVHGIGMLCLHAYMRDARRHS